MKSVKVDYAALVRASRRAQGLPDYVDNAATLARVATLLCVQREEATSHPELNVVQAPRDATGAGP